MRDHQRFECDELPNGITLYTYRDDFPISCMEVQLPVGSGHAIAENGFIAGSPHFLEHVQLIRSEDYPEAYALDRALGLRAGNSNAATHPTVTTHWIDTPASETDFGIAALISRVFRPVFKEKDLAVERGVIANERDQNKFYPGKNKTSHYYFSDFLNDTSYPLTQIFGSDENLENMDVEYIRDMHKRASTSNKVVALAVGPQDFSEFRDLLAAIPTTDSSFESQIAAPSWNKKDYHSVYQDTVAQPRLEAAWIHPRPTYEEYRAVCFVINLLVNPTQGPLYREFREEKGWTYGLDALCLLREHGLVLGLSFPFNSTTQIDYARACLADRIASALTNQSLIEDEITRQLGNQVYNYQTAGSIVSSASSDLITFGALYTEEDFRKATEAMRDPAWRSYILTTYFRPEDMGSMCFMPERREVGQPR